MCYIVNKYGVIHTIPAQLFGQVQAQGGRLATPSEIAAYEGGIDATVAEVFPTPAADDLTLITGIGDKTAEALSGFGIRTYAALITAVFGINATIGGLERYQADAAITALERRERPVVRLLRAGRWDSSPADTLVVLALASEAAGDLTTAKILATRASAEKGLPKPAKQAMARIAGL